MLGIILCGGQSLRMGADKGLLTHDDKVWALLAGDKLRKLDIPVAFSVNPIQQQAYAAHLEKEKLIVDQADLDIRGPLLGVLSAHLSHEAEDLFLLACDLVLMESSTLQMLLHIYKTEASFDVYIFTKDNEQEPLCGIYTSQGLRKVMSTLHTTGLEKHSMKFVLSKLRVCEIVLDEKDYRSFINFNSHSQINGL